MPKCGKMQAEQFFLRTNAAKDECKKKKYEHYPHNERTLARFKKQKKTCQRPARRNT